MQQDNSPQNLTQARLKELLHYDPETGIFTWLVIANNNKALVGTVAGSLNKPGYMMIGVDRKRYLAHRLAFLYMTGEWPSEQVDHINGERTDNRWCNLRAATEGENKHNIGGPPRTNTSGYLGVSWDKSRGKWRAHIYLRNVQHHLGRFTTPEAAHAAYLAAKDKLHPTHRRLRGEA